MENKSENTLIDFNTLEKIRDRQTHGQRIIMAHLQSMHNTVIIIKTRNQNQCITSSFVWIIW